ncbi:MAG: hypothetical protein PWP57_1125 [Candidatus Atribacteria bacterium]|nr:hypothetical protein [Candidatus Atribacteria bacterium]
MRSRDFYWMLALIASLGFLVFLSFNFWNTLNSEEENSLPVLSPLASPVASSSSLDDIKEEELFLVSYPEEKLADFRDLFHSAIPIAQEIEEEQVAAFPEELREEVVFLPPESTPPQEQVEVKEELPPPVHLQGVVVSGSRQAVIVEVGGKIQILTNEKNLSSNIKLVKVEGKEVVLNYEGREITLTFEK